MKKKYMQPTTDIVQAELAMIVCGSQDITSNADIDYGGVDEDGDKDPASRRQNVWDDEEEEEEDY